MRTIGRFGLGKGVGVAIGLLCLALSVPGKVDAGPTYYDGTGHWYELVETSSPLMWDEAKELAEDAGGHLATLALEPESEWVIHTLLGSMRNNEYNGAPYLGGYQDPWDHPNAAENWHWVTDEPWDYTDWVSGDPNDHSEPEWVLTGQSYGFRWGWQDVWQWEEEPYEGFHDYVVEYDANPIPAPGALVLALVGVGLTWAGSRFRRKG